jgi:hypothetical protein
MNTVRLAASICYVLSALLLMTFGVMYLTRSKFMPYHQQAIGIPWENLDTRMQTLLLTLMRVSGGGMLAVALSVLVLVLGPFREGNVWAIYALPAIGLASGLPILYATIFVRKRTQTSSPVGISAFGVAIVVLGFVLSLCR